MFIISPYNVILKADNDLNYILLVNKHTEIIITKYILERFEKTTLKITTHLVYKNTNELFYAFVCNLVLL